MSFQTALYALLFSPCSITEAYTICRQFYYFTTGCPFSRLSPVFVACCADIKYRPVISMLQEGKQIIAELPSAAQIQAACLSTGVYAGYSGSSFRNFNDQRHPPVACAALFNCSPAGGWRRNPPHAVWPDPCLANQVTGHGGCASMRSSSSTGSGWWQSDGRRYGLQPRLSLCSNNSCASSSSARRRPA